MTESPKDFKDLAGPPPHDDLDGLLRAWHDVNAEHAAAARGRLMARLRRQRAGGRRPAAEPSVGDRLAAVLATARRLIVNRYSPALASLLLLVVIASLLVPNPRGAAFAQQILVPEGGRLDALDEEGNILGPCPLRHTDVDANISGFFSRVTVTQTYANPYPDKIEAVYTFPLSHRAAVDRMTMTIGDRVVEGEVKEREAARQIYEAARERGYVASLLEQERPNIFTQSIANIEPGASVVVEISYVEILAHAGGAYSFDFPMVVGPRYIPGPSTASPSPVPAELEPRRGLVLLGPAALTLGAAGDVATLGTLQGGKLGAILDAAGPIKYPGDRWWGRGGPTGGAGQPQLWHRFEAGYADGSREFGELYTDGTGQLDGRWFYCDPATVKSMGTGFAQDTARVPDASRITPQPVRPPTRAGHDVAVRITIDTGGPGILDVKSALHEIEQVEAVERPDGNPRVLTLALKDESEIPNRDFVLSWRQTADAIEEATFVHTDDHLGEYSGGFFTLILQPPARVSPADVPPRELVFVLDTSGSMSGRPIEKSKAVMARALDAMRPGDTFNVITFAGHTAVLWTKPRPADAENRAEAKRFVESLQGAGGTEMMKAIDAALVQAPAGQADALTTGELADLPADGRPVTVRLDMDDVVMWPPPNVRSSWTGIAIQLDEGTPIQVTGIPVRADSRGRAILVATGRWVTRSHRRILEIDQWHWLGDEPAAPMRIALFLTDGYVGNDMAIIDAVRRNASTTRVFSFGIGNSVNRYLLDNMAIAGRGEAEFVLLNDDADAAVERLTRRIETPVLADINLAFSDGLQVTDLLPAPGEIPDLWDVEPLVIHGRYTPAPGNAPAKGTLTIRGRTGAGPYERTLDLELPADAPDHDVIATLWARARVDQVMAPNLQAVQNGWTPDDVKRAIVKLGEQFSIMTQFTSFVAVERSRLTVGGKPVLVAVPVELPEGTLWEGFFGGEAGADTERVTLGVPVVRNEELLAYMDLESGKRAGNFNFRAPAPPPDASTLGRTYAGRRGQTPADGPVRGLATTAGQPVQAGTVTEEQLRRLPTSRDGNMDPSASKRATTLKSAEAPQARANEPEVSRSLSAPQRKAPPAEMDEIAAVEDKESAGAGAGISGGFADATQALDLSPREQEAVRNRVLALDREAADRRAGGKDARVRTPEGRPAGGSMPGDIPLLGDAFQSADAGQATRLGEAFDRHDAATPQPLTVQDVAVAIGQEAKSGDLKSAGELADALTRLRPDYDVGIKMRDALDDQALAPAARREAVMEQAGIARRQIEDAESEAARRLRLRRVLDPALLALIEPAGPMEKAPGAAMKLPRIGSRLLVTVLVDSVNDTVTDALKRAGLSIEDTSKSLPIIVGTVTADRLEAIALVEGVRRIEPSKIARERPQGS